MDDFVALIDKHRDEFFRYILRTAWDSNVAEDVFQSAVLAAYENYHKFTPGTNFRAWVYRIITNKCFVANRNTARTFDPLDKIDESLIAIGDRREYGYVLEDAEAVIEQCGDEMFRAFRRLSTAERSCIMLRGIERFSYQEIAEILEMPVGTVMTHLSRGRAKLRQELTDYALESGIIKNAPRLLPKKTNVITPSAEEANS
jgi:RNA polymerase sigma-70 factor (ECF subfamily)